MPMLSEAIAAALAPGIGLTAVIFYNSSLQNRFIYITGRMREVNREARALPADAADRRESLRRQISLMVRRTRILRRAILTVYVALLGMVATILELLLLAALHPPGVEQFAVGTFAFALGAMALAAVTSWRENFLSQRTILEDVRSSFPELEVGGS